jgi:glycerol-3-phosphate cytidylyltransferase-like family protein
LKIRLFCSRFRVHTEVEPVDEVLQRHFLERSQWRRKPKPDICSLDD